MKQNILRIAVSLALRLSLGLTLCAGSMFAQGGRRGEGKVLEQLNLSEEQKPKVEAILKEQRAAMKDARTKNASRDEMRGIRQATKEKMKGVLSEEQMKKLGDSARKGMRKRKG